MATKIIRTDEHGFKPVKIELEFTTRSQLAAFIQVMYNPNVVAASIKNSLPLTKQAELMGEATLHQSIDELINVATLEQLIELADA